MGEVPPTGNTYKAVLTDHINWCIEGYISVHSFWSLILSDPWKNIVKEFTSIYEVFFLNIELWLWTDSENQDVVIIFTCLQIYVHCFS